MNKSIHYLIMSNHLMLQKSLLANVKDTGLTAGQPKVLDYLRSHDGAVQKEIAAACHIEPASLTSVLLGMEEKGLIERITNNDNRRYLYVFLTEKGNEYAKRLGKEFDVIESKALRNFTESEIEQLRDMLIRVYENNQRE